MIEKSLVPVLKQVSSKIYGFENVREVRDWLAEGDCDPSFSDPIDEALNMVEPHMEKFQK